MKASSDLHWAEIVKGWSDEVENPERTKRKNQLQDELDEAKKIMNQSRQKWEEQQRKEWTLKRESRHLRADADLAWSDLRELNGGAGDMAALAASHPGMEHKAGVPQGGAFTTVVQDQSGATPAAPATASAGEKK